jgi:hypothetical protein
MDGRPNPRIAKFGDSVILPIKVLMSSTGLLAHVFGVIETSVFRHFRLQRGCPTLSNPEGEFCRNGQNEMAQDHHRNTLPCAFGRSSQREEFAL